MATANTKAQRRTAVERATDAAAHATKVRTPEAFAEAVIALVSLPQDKLDAKLYAFVREHGRHVLAAPDTARQAITAAEQAAEAARKALEQATGTLTTARKGEAQRTREAELFCHRVIDVHRIMTQAEFVKAYGISQGQVSRYQLAGRGMTVTGRTSDRAAVDLYSLAGNSRKALSEALKVKDPAKREQAVVKLLDAQDTARKASKSKPKPEPKPEPLVEQAARQAVELTASLVVLNKGTDTIPTDVWRALMHAVTAYDRRHAAEPKRQPVAPVKKLPVPNSERKAS